MISPGPLQELLTRTCIQDHAQASDSISLGSPEDLRTRNCKRPWARSSRQDPEEKLTRYRHKRTCRCSGLQVCPATLGGGLFLVVDSRGNYIIKLALATCPRAFRLRSLAPSLPHDFGRRHFPCEFLHDNCSCEISMRISTAQALGLRHFHCMSKGTWTCHKSHFMR